MKLYVAGRFQSHVKVRGVIDHLLQQGHEITYDWTRSEEFTSEGEPVQSDPHNLDKNKLIQYALEDLAGVAHAEVVIVCADDSLAGGYIEMGYGLATGCHIFVVAHERWTIFYELHDVTHFKTYEDLYAYTEKLV
jgi:hypothetical protein